MLNHPLLAGVAVLVLEGLVEYILSWGSVWRPVVTGGIVTLLLVLMRFMQGRGLPPPREEEVFNEQQDSIDAGVETRKEKKPSEEPESVEVIPLLDAVHADSSSEETDRSLQPFIANIVIFMKGRSYEEREPLNKRYKGRRISVEGKIRHMSAPKEGMSKDPMYVYLRIPHPDPNVDHELLLDVDCTFDAKKWLDELINYTKGDTIRVVGAIERISYFTIDLDECALDHSAPQDTGGPP